MAFNVCVKLDNGASKFYRFGSFREAKVFYERQKYFLLNLAMVYIADALTGELYMSFNVDEDNGLLFTEWISQDFPTLMR